MSINGTGSGTETQSQLISELRRENAELKERLKLYEEGRGEFLKQNVSCCICLRGFDDMDNNAVTKCKHIYHDRCLRKWCRKHIECPYCRTPDDKWWYYPSSVPFYVRVLHGKLW